MTKDDKQKSPRNFPVVGVGASAGGLEALEQLFHHMPLDAEIAFVVIQHLSPDYKSMMGELLSKRTKMPVHEASDGMIIQPNNIYLLPPKKNITVFDRKLYLAERESQHLHLPIDIFLNSLAEDLGKSAIAIILSGTGSDGTRGIRAIKEAGGMVMVQDVQSAKFDGMPRSAIATKLVDYVLPPEKMAEALVQYVRFPSQVEDLTQLSEDDSLEEQLRKLFHLLQNQTNVDFSQYKRSTMLRRIERRMSINQIENLNDYLHHLYQFPVEVNALYQELLIGVTRFFRDPEAFDTLQNEIIPKIFEYKPPNEQIRVWVAGCSTGEEAYSLAILFSEYMQVNGDIRDVKIFATDLDREAVDYAGRGSYPESTIADISMERLHRYFVKAGDHYEVTRRVREMVIFAQQDMTQDPPFSKIDLISCRNVLIYLQPPLQQRVLSLFQFALNKRGFLFLGTSETIGEAEANFQSISHKWKIYRYQGGVRPRLASTLMTSRQREPASSTTRPTHKRPIYVDELRSTEKIYRNLITEFMPPTVIINEDHEVQHIFGKVDRFLQIPTGGQFSADLFKMVRKPLSIPLNTAVHKAQKEEREVIYNNVALGSGNDGETRIIDLVAKPLLDLTTRHNFLAVQFREATRPSAPQEAETFDVNETASQRIADLEQELQYTQENLQATIEELETTNEELQATNEELLAANEELQSTNEELQSVNEELITVNAEYQMKIKELTNLNTDLNNLFSNTDVGVVFLDEQLQIRRFTPAAQEAINLLEQDVGRPLQHIAHQLEGVDLVENARNVLNTLDSVETNVSGESGQRYLLRVRPYFTLSDAIGGVIISLVDVSDLWELRRVNAELEQINQEGQETMAELEASQTFLRSVLDALPAHIAILNKSGKILAVNQVWRQFAEENGLDWDAYNQDINYLEVTEAAAAGEGEEAAQAAQIAAGMRRVIAGELDQFSLEYPCHSPQEKRWFLVQVTPFQDATGTRRVVVAHDDVTQVKSFEAQFSEAEERLRRHFRSSPVPNLLWQGKDGEMVLVDLNEAAAEMAQRPFSELIPTPAATLFARRPTIVDQMQRCREENSIHTEVISNLSLFGRPPQDFQFTYTYLLGDTLLLRTVPLTKKDGPLPFSEAEQDTTP